MNKKDAVTKNLIQALLAGADSMAEEIEVLIRQWMEQGITRGMPHAHVYYRLGDEILSHEASGSLCRYLPRLLADVTRHELLIVDNAQEPYRSHDLLDLGIRTSPDGFPPDQFKGPFLGLLRLASKVGAELVLDLINHATQAWVRRERSSWYSSEGGQPLPQRLVLDGQAREIWGDAQVWRWFRYPTVASNAITSALMALEHWLSDLLQGNADANPLFDFLLRRTNSAAIIGVISSIAMKYPEKCAQVVLPILRCPGFWMMDKQRLLFDQTEAILVTSEEAEWYWIRRAAREEHRRGDLEDLALRLMLTDATYRAELLPAIRTFPKALPYTDERQVGNELAEAELRETCEFMVLRTDIENLALVEMGNGVFGFEPIVMPEHLARAQEESEKLATQQNELLGLRMWALKQLDGEPPGDRYTLETALAAVQRIATEAEVGAKDLFFSQMQKEVVALVAAALVCCHGSLLRDESAIKWCREQLLAAALEEKVDSPVQHAYGHYLWGPQRSAARALPQLLARFPDDEELRLTVAVLSVHWIEEVRSFTYAALNSLWETMPAFVWRCICLGVAYALRQLDKMGGEEVEAFSDRLASHLERAASDGTEIEPEALSGKTSTDLDWKRLESIVQAIPATHISLDRAWRLKLTALYEDWLHFTLATHIDIENADWERREHLPQLETWDRLFFQSLGQFILPLNPDEAALRFVDPILVGWERTPRLMEAFLRYLLNAASKQGVAHKGFVTLWKGIGERVLSATTIQGHHFQHDHSIENILALLVFADPYTYWHVDQWEPVSECTDLIEQWIATVGYVPACFRALIRLLTTIGFPLFVEKGVAWLFLCLTDTKPADLLLRKESNAAALAGLLKKAYDEQKEALVAVAVNWRKYNALVDRLVRTGEPTAVDLQLRIRSSRRPQPKRPAEGGTE
jgi:hypothetical protein